MITHDTAFGEPVIGTGGDKSKAEEFHLSETNGSYRARTWTTRITDRDVNHYVIFLPPCGLTACKSIRLLDPNLSFKQNVAVHALKRLDFTKGHLVTEHAW